MSHLQKALPGKPVKEDIEVVRNDTFLYKIIGWTQDGTPYDFTGHTFKMQVKEKRAEGEDPIVDITDADFTIGQDSRGTDAGVNNTVTIEHAKENFDIEAKDYVYDIEMTDATGKVQTIQQEDCFFRVNQDVSQ